MNRGCQNPVRSQTLSAAARERMLSLPREPLFIGDWLDVVMIHLEVEAKALQAATPFTLDLRQGRAFVSLVAFTLRGMHPRFGGRPGEWIFRPLATHHFLNVRTYVRHGEETGIHFLAEWLDCRLAVALGPPVFGLPYRFGRIHYANGPANEKICGEVWGDDGPAAIRYRGRTVGKDYKPCAEGSLDEWLMERYAAFNSMAAKQRFFRVWHEPWPQVPVAVELADRSLLVGRWPFLEAANVVGANYSPGLHNVWMGWPHRVRP